MNRHEIIRESKIKVVREEKYNVFADSRIQTAVSRSCTRSPPSLGWQVAGRVIIIATPDVHPTKGYGLQLLLGWVIAPISGQPRYNNGYRTWMGVVDRQRQFW